MTISSISLFCYENYTPTNDLEEMDKLLEVYSLLRLNQEISRMSFLFATIHGSMKHFGLLSTVLDQDSRALFNN